MRSGSEALAALASTNFDVVLCDLDLGPGINGIEVLDRIPQKLRGAPFVILTGHGTIDRFREAQRHGATEFLEKPISDAQLFSALDRVLGLTDSVREGSGSDELAWPEELGDAHVRHALRIIERKFSDPDFSVDALATAIGITADHLTLVFRKHLNRRPLQQIHETRIRAAEKLLDAPALSIYEIAIDCGYRTTTDFDAWFRHFRGMTPSEWRDRESKLG